MKTGTPVHLLIYALSNQPDMWWHSAVHDIMQIQVGAGINDTVTVCKHGEQKRTQHIKPSAPDGSRGTGLTAISA